AERRNRTSLRGAARPDHAPPALRPRHAARSPNRRAQPDDRRGAPGRPVPPNHRRGRLRRRRRHPRPAIDPEVDPAGRLGRGDDRARSNLNHVKRRAASTPLADALARVGDRWTLLVVATLLEGPKRFNELQEELEGIAPN